MKCRLQKFIPVFFHNFSGYDCHLIFEKLLSKWFELIKPLRDTNPNQYNTLKPCILPKSIEKYISIEIGHLRFLDSNSFLQSSLEKNVSCLPKESFTHLNSQLYDDPLFKKKLAYPYELCTTLEDYYKPIAEGPTAEGPIA